MEVGIIRLQDARLERGGRMLWKGLDTAIKPGEFIAVLGPNGAGKTSLLKVLLGLLPLSGGSATVYDKPPQRGNESIGYIPQHKSFDSDLPIRGRDLVQLGMNGHRYGFSRKRTETSARVEHAIRQVGAGKYAGMPIGQLSGGEQQRLRVAQALVGEPGILLCDEPLLSLDFASQNTVINLINDYRTSHNAAVMFVTHEINPILPWVDRVLYIANGRWVIDSPQKVLQSETLTKLYGTPVEVIRLKGRVIVVGVDDMASAHHEAHA